jgi:hypothetical protein
MPRPSLFSKSIFCIDRTFDHDWHGPPLVPAGFCPLELPHFGYLPTVTLPLDPAFVVLIIQMPEDLDFSLEVFYHLGLSHFQGLNTLWGNHWSFTTKAFPQDAYFIDAKRPAVVALGALRHTDACHCGFLQNGNNLF